LKLLMLLLKIGVIYRVAAVVVIYSAGVDSCGRHGVVAIQLLHDRTQLLQALL